ncbi:MAG: DUF1223 domain-containing protein [Pseudomonadota bacterium]
MIISLQGLSRSAAKIVLGASLALSATLTAHATELRGVVEMFTSQGCSSCPPADAALVDYAGDPSLLALSYHVDYWDYLGWKDTLGSAENTARQRAYAHALKARSVYTPQAVVNGSVHHVGSDRTSIDASLARGGASGMPIPVSISKNASRLQVSVDTSAVDLGETDIRVILVYIKNDTRIDIKRGENAGRKQLYAHSVLGMQTMGMVSGTGSVMEMPVAEMMKLNADNCAVIVQAFDANGNPGEILGAALLEPSPFS